MIRRPLAADAYVFALGDTGLDGLRQQHAHSRIALVEVGCEQLHAGIAVQAQSQLGQVVGTDGETVEVLKELLCQ